jgi:MinD superfamily P-loop ATPase
MTELVVCSGKGGTGKTSVVAALASLADGIVLADCDVDAANLHLVLRPEVEQAQPFFAGHIASIDSARCLACGECQELCQFSAITSATKEEGDAVFTIDPLLCEGCGVCVRFCPNLAIDFESRHCGQWFTSRTPVGPLAHAALDVAAENSGKLVTLVREKARHLAERLNLELILIDGPPGIGCPLTASLTGADLVLLVAEPSISGLHDLKRTVKLVSYFGLPALVVINKHDLSARSTTMVESYCHKQELPVIGKIPFEPLVNEAQAAGRSLVEFAPLCEASRVLTAIWHGLEHRLTNINPAKG